MKTRRVLTLDVKRRTGAVDRLVSRLDSMGGRLDADALRETLLDTAVMAEDLASFVEENPVTYARRTVVRREGYEVLALTWLPGQRSLPHDHAGVACALRVVRGNLVETHYTKGNDGLVRQAGRKEYREGEVVVDEGGVIHTLENPSDRELLVTLHVYAPPLPEQRRYVETSHPPAAVFSRGSVGGGKVPTVAIIGGGFTGAMTLVNLLRYGAEQDSKFHVVLIDRQTALGEGVAYRTMDRSHLLNVPTGRMSAFPDRPDDFLEYVRLRDPDVSPYSFQPRRVYGQYVREMIDRFARNAPAGISAEILRDEATGLTPGYQGVGTTPSGWRIVTAGGRVVEADAVVLAVGHRPPDDVLASRWEGPRQRYISDPWATMQLSQIRPDEPVFLLGTGLTAVDAVLSLTSASIPQREAPIFALSRRGMLPQAHWESPLPPLARESLADLIASWVGTDAPLTARQLLADLRRRIVLVQAAGGNWRQVIDALRPRTSVLWEKLSLPERARFLQHLRPYWEVHRHRMAPSVAAHLEALRSRGLLRTLAGTVRRVVAMEADNLTDPLRITWSERRFQQSHTSHAAWLVNCTGPGVQNRHSTHPILLPLLESGELVDDELSLGLRTDPNGRAFRADGVVHDGLFIAGTLRKSTLWESTAVPELREQASDIACLILEKVISNRG